MSSPQFHVPLPYPFRMASEILQNQKSIALIKSENGQHCLLFLMLDQITTTVPITAEMLLSLHGSASYKRIEKNNSIKKIAVIMQSKSHWEYFQLQLSPYIGVHLFDHVPSNASEYSWVIGLHLRDNTVIPLISSHTLIISSTMPSDEMLAFGFYDPFDHQDYKTHLEGYKETIIRYMPDNISIPEFGHNAAFASMALAIVLAIQERMDRKRRFVFLGYDEGSFLLQALNTAFEKLSMSVTIYKHVNDVNEQKGGVHLIFAKSAKELLPLKYCNVLLLPPVFLTTERIKDSMFYAKTRLCEHVFLTPSDHASSLQSFLKAQPSMNVTMKQLATQLSNEEYTIRLLLGLEDVYEKSDGKIESFDTLRDLCDSNLQVQKIVFSTSESADVLKTKKDGGYSITFNEKWTKPLDVCFMKYIAMAQKGMYRVPCLKAYESAMIETLKNNVITNVGKDSLDDHVYTFPKYIPKAFEKTEQWNQLMESKEAPASTEVYVTTIHVDKKDQMETLAIVTLHPIDTANIPPEFVYFNTSDASPTQITFRSWTPDDRTGIGYQPIQTLTEILRKEAAKTTDVVDDDTNDFVMDTFSFKERVIPPDFPADRKYEPIFLDAYTMKRVKDFQKAFTDIVCGSLHVGITQELNIRSYFLLPMSRCSSNEWGIDWKTVDRLLSFPQVTGWEWITNAINYVNHFFSRQQPIPSPTFNSTYDDLIANYGTIRSQVDESTKISEKILPEVQKILSSMFMITRHNLHKYSFLNLRLDVQPDHIMVGGNRKKPRLDRENETFQEYVERQGYTISHPKSCMIEGKLFGKFSSHAMQAEQESSRSIAQLVPDAVIMAPCSAGIWQVFKLLPTLFYGLLNSMAANDLRKMLAIPYVNVPTLITALTSSPVDKNNNFERLEFLGDGFLKKAVSYDLYKRFPDADEGNLTGRRAWRVSNAYLKDLAIKWDIPKYINNTAFEPERWAPSWTTNALWKSLEQNVEKQGFSLKMIADIMEAIIGSVYYCAGNDFTDLLLNKLGIVSNEAFSDRFLLDIHMDDCQKRTYFNQEQPSVNHHDSVTVDSEVAHVQRAFEYQPKDFSLFQKAFTSANGQQLASYERLEFLGDAILDWFVVRYIFLSFPNYSPGMMTDLKHHVVNNEAFARISVSLRLHFPLLKRAPALKAEVDKYVEFLMTKDDAKKPLDTQYYGPKCLGDVFESVVGAMFVDMDYNTVQLWDLIRPVIKGYLFDPILHDQLENEKYGNFVRGTRHPVRLFQELLQQRKIKISAIEYRFDDHDPKSKNDFRCRLFVNGHLVSEATSKTKSVTKRRAAELGIRKIENNFGYVRQLKKPNQEETAMFQKPLTKAPPFPKPAEISINTSLPTLISQDLDEEVDMDLETPYGSPSPQRLKLSAKDPINSLFDELDMLLEEEKLFTDREPSPEMV